MSKFKLCFLDEEDSWRYMAKKRLSDEFDVTIVEQDEFPQAVSELWTIIKDSDADVVIVDYRLNESGILSYTGDAVVREIRKHNRHLPVFMITSYESNAIQECEEVQIIRGKDMLSDVEKSEHLKLLIKASVERYIRERERAEKVVQVLSAKIDAGSVLSEPEEADRFDAEIYLSELDLDSGVRASLCRTETSANLLKLVEQTTALLSKLS